MILNIGDWERVKNITEWFAEFSRGHTARGTTRKAAFVEGFELIY